MVTSVERLDHPSSVELSSPIDSSRSLHPELTPESLAQRKVEQLDSSKEQLQRIQLLLIKANSRTEDERIELFNLLLTEGKRKAQEAKNRDIVLVFGNTDAGKSVLINRIHDRPVILDAEGRIVVDPNSPLKEITKIGMTTESCTLLPEPTPPLTLKNANEEEPLTFFDMPGLSDNRGVEVALAQAIITKYIISQARSVRFVMVFEKSQLFASKGAAWKEAVQLVEERFNHSLGREKNSLCIVLNKDTKPEDLPKYQREIKKHVSLTQPLDLSSYAITFNPLFSKDRDHLLQTIFNLKAYQGFSNQISMSRAELWDSYILGQQIGDAVESDLEHGHFDKALSKARFTYEVSNLGNEGLTKPHELVAKVVHEYVKKIVEDLNPLNKLPFKTRVQSFKKYLSIRDQFKPFVNFDEIDRSVRIMIDRTPDKRWISWDKPYPTLVCGLSTLGLGILSYPLRPMLLLVPFPLIGVAYSLYHWLLPSEEEHDTTIFFKGP